MKQERNNFVYAGPRMKENLLLPAYAMLSLLSRDMNSILPAAIILNVILTCFLLELSDLQEQGQNDKIDWVGPSVTPTEV